MKIDIENLSSVIAECAKKAFSELFLNNEHYYYCVLLVTTESGDRPFISAWSWEALERESEEHSPEYAEKIKSSYADSPYCNFGEEFFQPFWKLFEYLPSLYEIEDDAVWEKEYNFRLSAMELAMRKLDEEELFSIKQPGKTIY